MDTHDNGEAELDATLTEIGIVETRRAIEAILMVATDPTPASLLAQLLEVQVEHVELLCHALADSYAEANHGFQLVKVAGGWRYQTHPDMAPYVERFAMDGQSAKLSNAALETLAIVAYKQPISRAQVSAIRGVNVDAVLRTLVQRGYVDEIGRDTGAGQAVLFGTTSLFLERLGVNSAADLPALGEFVPSAEVVEALEQTLKVNLDPDFATDMAAADEAPGSTSAAAADGPDDEPVTEAEANETVVEPEPVVDEVEIEPAPHDVGVPIKVEQTPIERDLSPEPAVSGQEPEDDAVGAAAVVEAATDAQSAPGEVVGDAQASPKSPAYPPPDGFAPGLARPHRAPMDVAPGREPEASQSADTIDLRSPVDLGGPESTAGDAPGSGNHHV
jgi:segregation and condensation protein B